MEILAPAGSPEGLVAAIQGGCNAVYLGGEAYGARTFSANFTDSQIEGAVKYAHERNVKVYVTVNTLIKDSEMDDAVSYVRFLSDIGVDAVLIQDLGLFERIRDIDIPKHASTQMGIHSRAGLEWCHENGIERAILARELTFEEISDIVKDSPVEVEVFVQGAMCYSMSGGCLFSSVIGGRSGNRGQCAQPCRKKYHKDGESGFLLSCTDMYALDYIPKLKEIGVVSAKIEGRMRSPAYAYLASKVYSMKERGEPDEDIASVSKLLHTIFNRGISEGYFGGVISPVQSLFPDNRGYRLGTVTIKNKSFLPSEVNDKLNVRDGISLFRGDVKVGGFRISDTVKVTAPFSIPDGKYDVYRTYDPRIDTIKNSIGSVPVFTGNTKRKKSKKFQMNRAVRNTDAPDISFYISSIRNLEAVLKYADRIYFETGDNLKEAEEICKASGTEFVTILPRFDPSDIAAPSSVMVNTVGQMHANRDSHRVYGNQNVNMFNSFYPNAMYQTTLSPELNRDEIRQVTEYYPGRLEIMVFGRQELMHTRDPGMSKGMLEDHKGFKFPVYGDDDGTFRILNSADLILFDYLDELQSMGFDSFGIDLRKRPEPLAKIVAEAFAKRDGSKKKRIVEMCGSVTTGHYNRGVI